MQQDSQPLFFRPSGTSVNHMPNGRKNELWNMLQSMLGRVFHHLFAVAFANHLPIEHVRKVQLGQLKNDWLAATP